MTSAELAAGFGLPLGAGVAEGVESHYLGRLRLLPRPTQQLLLLAASDGVGDATTIWRAASDLGIGSNSALPAVNQDLFEVGARVRFRHPLVRSAVYKAASQEDRRAAHKALAEATDPQAEPDRRAWHRAHACSGPDEDVAAELEQAAGRAQARGGYAAAAALLERSASLTMDPNSRVERWLDAVRCNVLAGAFEAGLRLLAVAESEALDEWQRARIDLLRAHVASSSDAGGDAPYQLLQAARRLEPLDAALAQRTYADAWIAAMFAGHLARPDADLLEVSKAARASRQTGVPLRPHDQIAKALLELVASGRVVAEPMLRDALRSLQDTDLPAENWLEHAVMAVVAAAAVWDLDAWVAIGTRQVELARELGALAGLPTSLSGLAMVATWRGDFESAAALMAEAFAVTEATGIRIAPYGAMLLAAYRGRAEEATALITTTTQDSIRRREGLGVDLARWSAAVFYNGLGRYAEALAVATPADVESPGLLFSTWMLPERIEAAVRCQELDVAATALKELESTESSRASEWRRGIGARSRALLSVGSDADVLYREAVERLAQAQVRVELARAHLLYGEWLRRENRRRDARTHLRNAHEMFVAMSADGFAERARHELLVTGEHVRSRQTDNPAELTPQEEHLARLARDGRTNPEIGAELFISPRTVEWHLRKVFNKLGITSRNALRDALAPTAAGQQRNSVGSARTGRPRLESASIG